jgi:hypothetical protein
MEFVSMSALKIVHLAPTPLVGAPAKVAQIQAREGHSTLSFIFGDYPKELAGKFLAGNILMNAPELEPVFVQALAEADIVHIHNYIPVDRVATIRAKANNAAFIYQVHSGLREGPMYASREKSLGLPFAARLAVAQYHPRHYPDYTPVPNLVDAKPTFRLPHDRDKLRLLYKPSHPRGGRWNAKTTPKVEETLKSLSLAGIIELVAPTQGHYPNSLLELRRTTHLTIDEVITGSYHQVSLEGLCAGNVVINNSDFFSSAMLQQVAQATEPPPFVRANESTLAETLIELAHDRAKTLMKQVESKEYFEQWLAPKRLIHRYLDIYQEARRA